MDVLNRNIRSHVAARPEASIRSVAETFRMTEGEILSALEGHLSVLLNGVDPAWLVEEMADWGRVRMVVRNGLAVSELIGTMEGARFGKGWLTLENDHFHLHFKAEQVMRIYLLRRMVPPPGRSSFSVHWLDGNGEAGLKCFLLDPDENSDGRKRFDRLFVERKPLLSEAEDPGTG